jgi:dTDP-4-dehydrorhamnose reductase
MNNNDCLIGYTGFVGQKLLSQKKFKFLFNSKNINKIKNKKFNYVFCAGAPGIKWMANKYPKQDLASINVLKKNIENISCKKFILISTVDVYSNSINKTEKNKPTTSKKNFYGKNRLDLEKFVMKNFDNFLIIRLTALVGKQLKKNILYDIKNKFQLDKINKNSVYQYYPIDNLLKDIKKLLNEKNKVIHLNSEPINVDEILNDNNLSLLDGGLIKKKELYNLKSIYSKKYKNIKNYFYNKKKILFYIKKYLHEG